jgi:cbb3-type cytochrome oxidase subunit 3
VDEKSKGKAVKSSIGVIGAIVTIISVWWFAFRPRGKKDEN